MRKICVTVAVVLLLGCLISMSTFADGPLSLRVRATGQFDGNLAGTIEGVTVNADVAGGYAIGFEALYKVFPYLQIGAGVEYQFLRDVTYQGADLGNLQFVPIYGMVRVPFPLGHVEPYIVGRIGYGIYSGDSTFTESGLITINNGLYFGLGGGVDYRFGGISVFAEATYALDDGSRTLAGVTENDSYTMLDISVGLGFSL